MEKKRASRARLIGAVAWAFASSATAGDGVLEINQVCALAGCFPGDAAGFPVTLTQPGSYRLTSDVVAGVTSVPVISIGVERVTLDLGGFTVSGGGGTPTGAAIQGGHRVTVRNGFVRSSAGDGVQVGGSSRVDDLHVSFNAKAGVRIAGEGTVRNVVATGNAGDGVAAGAASVIDGCTATANGGHGIRLMSGTLRGSTATQNAGRGGDLGVDVAFATNFFKSNGGGDVSGGHASGGNICGDRSCTTDGRKRYFLTQTAYLGGAARQACPAGFHMAALFELIDPSAFHYDSSQPDALVAEPTTGGPGPPAAGGWVRTPNLSQAQTSGNAGVSSCDHYQSSSLIGTIVAPSNRWDPSDLNHKDSVVAPWVASTWSCGTPASVWCMED